MQEIEKPQIDFYEEIKGNYTKALNILSELKKEVQK